MCFMTVESRLRATYGPKECVECGARVTHLRKDGKWVCEMHLTPPDPEASASSPHSE